MTTLDRLLERTSRTFALCIPLLPPPTRNQVTLAYLLFRIADTFEDAAVWPRERRLQALEAFGALLEATTPDQASQLAEAWMATPPTHHEGYVELLDQTPFVLQRFEEIDAGARAIITQHVQHTTQLMAKFVARTDADGCLRLRTLDDLRDYCYAVAGVVGEMLTELFVHGQPQVEPIESYLHSRAYRFGEGLQLTNILKDASVDANEGRQFLPATVDREDVFALARADLDAAAEYTLALQKAGASRGIVAFNALPLRLARATLNRVEEQGPGAKLTRPEVFAILDDLHGALEHHRPAVEHSDILAPLWRRVCRREGVGRANHVRKR